MARLVVKQPNGLLAVWSTIVDNFIIEDATRSELIEEFLKEERKKIEELIDTPSRLSYDDCLGRIERKENAIKEEKEM